MRKKILDGASDTPISIKITEGLRDELDKISKQTARTRSMVAKLLIIKGLQAYEADQELVSKNMDGFKKVTLPKNSHGGTIS